MKKFLLHILCMTVLVTAFVQPIQAQEKQIPQLIVKAMNEANAGFPTLMQDAEKDAVLGWKLKPEVAKQYANVKKVVFQAAANQHSQLYKDSLFTMHEMTIKSPDIVFEKGKTWVDYKDTLNTYFKGILNFYITAFGKQLSYSPILIDDSKEQYKPIYAVYFYNKGISIANTVTDRYEIERILDISAWFCIELKKGTAFLDGQFTDVCYIQYRVSGGQLQPK